MDFKGLLEPQIEHSLRLLNSIYLNGYADDLSDTGCGKTFCACWIAKQLCAPVVVICPNPVKSIWRRTLAEFGIYNATIINYDLLVRGNTEYLNYDLTKFHRTAKWWLSEGIKTNFRKDSLIIVDEQHRGRGMHSLTSDLLIVLSNERYKVLGLSATAATSVADMKAFGFKAKLHNGENYHQWCQDHGATVTRWGGIDWDASQTQAKEGMRRIHERIFDIQKTASRMRRAEFGNLFPDNHLIADAFDMGDAAQTKLNRVYDQMQLELDLLDRRSADYSSHIFAIMMKARRMSEIIKTPAAVEYIKDMFDSGISPVIFVNFDDTVQSLTRLLAPYKQYIGYLVGGQDEHEREQQIADFQSNKLRIFIANGKAGNLGISLHDLQGTHPRNSIIFPCWSAIDIQQIIGRIWRVKGKSPCIQRFFYAAGTLEERMAARLQIRLENLNLLNDGDLELVYQFLAQ